MPNLEDRPLALCDSRSVDPKDLMAADRIIPDRVGEVYYLTHNPKHRWYVNGVSVWYCANGPEAEGESHYSTLN